MSTQYDPEEFLDEDGEPEVRYDPNEEIIAKEEARMNTEPKTDEEFEQIALDIVRELKVDSKTSHFRPLYHKRDYRREITVWRSPDGFYLIFRDWPNIFKKIVRIKTPDGKV